MGGAEDERHQERQRKEDGGCVSMHGRSTAGDQSNRQGADMEN